MDGEAVVYVDGRVDFGAAQARAASSPARAAQLATRWPASFAAWDILAHAELGDVRSRPYVERRSLLLDVLEEVGPPLQAVPATDDRDTALVWYEALRAQRVEAPVAEHASSVYRAARIWRKIRHADTLDVDVVGFTGPRSRPRALAVRLPGGRTVLSQTVSAPVTREVMVRLADVDPGRPVRTESGAAYEAVETNLVAEVVTGTTRHGVVTVTRLR
ncbi:DNA ligase [Streptomyces sp. NPDC088768]|uniref:DNA ligase n=1 Tax=Streptomyces sp. NPDC088768 TaxID=3365894 RepID=UPI003824B769